MSGNYISSTRTRVTDTGIDDTPFLNETGAVARTWFGGTIGFDGTLANLVNGQAFQVKALTELTTIAAAATTTTTIQLPAGALILAVPVRVTVALPVTTNFTVGDSGSATRFSTAAVSKAINSTDKGTKAGVYYNASATGVLITPDSTPSDATGRVRVTIYYIEVTPPTS
jgi:hypothetical protein